MLCINTVKYRLAVERTYISQHGFLYHCQVKESGHKRPHSLLTCRTLGEENLDRKQIGICLGLMGSKGRHDGGGALGGAAEVQVWGCLH